VVLVDNLVSYSIGVGPVGLALGRDALYFAIGRRGRRRRDEPDPAENNGSTRLTWRAAR